MMRQRSHMPSIWSTLVLWMQYWPVVDCLIMIYRMVTRRMAARKPHSITK